MIFVYARLGGSAMLRDSYIVRPYARSDERALTGPEQLWGADLNLHSHPDQLCLSSRDPGGLVGAGVGRVLGRRIDSTAFPSKLRG